MTWLRARLTGGPAEASVVEEAAAKRGITEAGLERARRALAVVSFRPENGVTRALCYSLSADPGVWAPASA
jgi:hypothetical protein